MKKIILTILLLLPLTGFTATSWDCPAWWTDHSECGEKWKLQWEIGERLKYENKKANSNSAEISKLKKSYQDLSKIQNEDFTKGYGDSLKANFIKEDHFDKATTTPINPEGGFIPVGLLAVMGLIIAGVLTFLGIRKRNKIV